MGRLTPLHENLIASYTLDELAVLCGTLDIPFEHLRGETLPARAWSLIQYADRHGKLPELVAQCRQDFPHRHWQVPPPRQPGEPDDDDQPAGVQVKVEGVSGSVNIGGIAEVRNNTGQVVVGGRNVVQIGSLNVPRWLVIALPLLFGQEFADGFFEAPFQQMDVALEGNAALRRRGLALRDLEAVNRIEEEQRAHALVEVVRAAAELLQRSALAHQIRERKLRAERLQRLVADSRVRRGDDLDQAAHDLAPAPPGWCASISTSDERISARCAPESASASCAWSRP